jgi:diaminopimelate decarboxylase
MTTEREFDPEATLEMPRPVLIDPELEEADPEKTLVRENWESTVIRRVAPHVAAVQSAVGEDAAAESRFGWEMQTLRLLSRAMTRDQGGQ